MDIERYSELTKKLDTSDIDWKAGGAAGLSKDEQFLLTYFSDIEAQTLMYMRDLLHTDAVAEPDVVAFLGIWNYEEYFHGHALAKLMAECGAGLESDRIAQVRKKAGIGESLLSFASTMVSRITNQSFITLFMTWGAVQELTTHEGYLRLRESTQNPVLAELCKRIAKQERMHFSWYYNNAKKRLEASPSQQKFVRQMLKWFWTPVGAGVKPDSDVAKLFATLFPGEHGAELCRTVDQKLSELPGLAGLDIMNKYLHGLNRKGLVALTA